MEHITDIEQELRRYEAEIYSASTEYKNLVQDAARKRAAYDVSFAGEILKLREDKDLKATVPEKEAIAVKNVQTLLTDCRIAESLAEGSKRHLVTLQSLLSSVQTRASLIKTERSLANMMAG